MWVRNHMEIAKLEKVTQELGANSYWLPLEQDRAGNPANAYQALPLQDCLFSTGFKSQNLSALLSPDFHDWREICFPNCLSLAGTGGVTGLLHALGLPHHASTRSLKNILPNPASISKKHQNSAGPLMQPNIKQSLAKPQLCAKALLEDVPASRARPLVCLFSNTEKFCFHFERSVWQTNLINPKLRYFAVVTICFLT